MIQLKFFLAVYSLCRVTYNDVEPIRAQKEKQKHFRRLTINKMSTRVLRKAVSFLSTQAALEFYMHISFSSAVHTLFYSASSVYTIRERCKAILLMIFKLADTGQSRRMERATRGDAATLYTFA